MLAHSMYDIQTVDDRNTNVRVWGNIVEDADTSDLIQAYVTHFSPIRSLQLVFVFIDEGTNISFEQMFKIFIGIKRFHLKYKLIESVNIYMNDKHIAQCCRCLMNLFSPSVPINILLKEA